jgi:hypothetical protein
MGMAIELPNNPSSQPMFHPYEDSPQLGSGFFNMYYRQRSKKY